jgi:glycosyltransferase involved in cell wall biosynthesis
MEYKSYILITPARNEEAYIVKTILSVISQTILPVKWVIVSDGSTDGTDDIVKRYLRGHPWIEFVRLPEQRERHFAAKVSAFNAGYELVKSLHYDFVACLDADISFEPDYFEFLLSKFMKYTRLGVAGTPFVEGTTHYDYRFTNIEHVSGACQIFRREGFADIGGYVPIKGGGIDWTAVTTARMKGWMTRTFTEKTCFHHRKWARKRKSLTKWFRHGKKIISRRSSSLADIQVCISDDEKPYVIGGALLFLGYAWAGLIRTERPVSPELMKFHRANK